MRILAAEDNAANRKVLAAMLAPAGAEITFAENGKEAVEAWSREAFDLVLMDVQMPEMDGISATRAIRAAEKEAGRVRIPIIALSADAMKHQVETHLAAGMDLHVAKPIKAAELFAALSAGVELAARRAHRHQDGGDSHGVAHLP